MGINDGVVNKKGGERHLRSADRICVPAHEIVAAAGWGGQAFQFPAFCDCTGLVHIASVGVKVNGIFLGCFTAHIAADSADTICERMCLYRRLLTADLAFTPVAIFVEPPRLAVIVVFGKLTICRAAHFAFSPF